MDEQMDEQADRRAEGWSTCAQAFDDAATRGMFDAMVKDAWPSGFVHALTCEHGACMYMCVCVCACVHVHVLDYGCACTCYMRL